MIKLDELKVEFEHAKREEHYTMYFENESVKQYILSKYTPKQDAISAIGEDRGNKQTVWIILGFALGYTVRELMKSVSEDVKIIVIEPDEKLLEAQMDYEQNLELKEKENIHFLSGEINQEFKERLSNYIPNSEINNIKIVCMSTYLRFYCKYFESLKEIIRDTIYLKIVDMNTVQRFNKLFTENIIKNRYEIAESYRFAELKDKYKDVPAVVVSAGPSLQKNIKYIKEFKGIVLVGNRTLAPVLGQGRKPDFLCAVDPGDMVVETIRGRMRQDVPLIVNDNVNHNLINAHKGKKYFIKTHSNAEELLGIEGIESISVGGSVATLCASAAQYMGCNPIIFIGQDCAYTDMKVHASNCSNDLLGEEKNNNVESVKLSKMLIDEYYGGKVLSSMDLIGFLRWFEKFIAEHPETTFINATEGGALMKGAINKPFKDIVEEHQEVTVPDLTQYDRKVYIKSSVDEHLKELVGTLRKVKKQASLGKTLSEQLKAEYKVFKGKRVNKIPELVRKLDDIDAKIKALDEAMAGMQVIFSNFYNETQTALTNKAQIGESEIEEGIRIAIESYNLYNNIAKASREIIDIIENN